MNLRRRLAAVPDARPAADLDAAIAESVRYLASDDAARSLAEDAYWPKWHSPWWHMLVLFELGEAHRIPDRAVRGLLDALDALPIKIFPIPSSAIDTPTPFRDAACHCALGCVHQVLVACGVDVDARLPWVAPWFPRYQLADGGASCDGDAYVVTHECPSSMVGTVPPLEAMLGRSEQEQIAFVDRAAGFLVARRLTRGSESTSNAEERDAAPSWTQLCFPRLYFYDVLRGLAVLTRWAELRERPLPLVAVAEVAAHLADAFPDGVVRPQREAIARCPQGWRPDPGGWARGPTTRFPLLDACSTVGAPSPALTRQWTDTRHRLIRLIDRGQIP